MDRFLDFLLFVSVLGIGNCIPLNDSPERSSVKIGIHSESFHEGVQKISNKKLDSSRNSTMFLRQYNCQNKHQFGSTEGGWSACVTPNLNKDSVVYSFGLGKDPAFDLAVIEKFGCQVHSFDPTPTGEHCFNNQKNKPTQWIFHEWGLHERDENMTFYVPKGHGQYSVQNSIGKYKDEKISRPGYRLSSVMKKLGHSHVHICKIDVEGSEWGIIDDIVENRPNIDQILFEFHYFDLDPVDFYSKKKLNSIGYRWFFKKNLRHFVKKNDPNGAYNFVEYSFIRDS